jgi:hypothetical protein
MRHFDGCGETTPAPWHAALLKQDGADVVPAKSLPWQIRQEANPELPGAFFADTP